MRKITNTYSLFTIIRDLFLTSTNKREMNSLNRERYLLPEMRSAYPLVTIIDLCLTTERSELFDPGETSNHKKIEKQQMPIVWSLFVCFNER